MQETASRGSFQRFLKRFRDFFFFVSDRFWCLSWEKRSNWVKKSKLGRFGHRFLRGIGFVLAWLMAKRRKPGISTELELLVWC